MITGSIQEKNGIYHMVLSWYEVLDGKQKRKQKWISTKLPIRGNKRNAESLLKKTIVEYENELQYGNGCCDEDMYFSAYIKIWLEERKTDKYHPIRENTWESYRHLMYLHVIPYFDQKCMKLKDLKRKDLEQFYRFKLQTLSANTVKKIHVNVHSALSCAVAQELIKHNPSSDVSSLPKIEKYHARFYNEKQLKELLDDVEGDNIESVVKLTVFYGFRRSEICGLRWSAIDFDEGIINVNHTAIKFRGVTHYQDKCKNESSFRRLPLSNSMSQYLKQIKCKQEMDKELYGNSYFDSDYICRGEDGTPITPDYLTHHFQVLLKRYNLPYIRFHDLRHSSASNLLRLGFGLKEIQEWLGHANISITADIYSHLEFEAKVKMADKLDECIAI